MVDDDLRDQIARIEADIDELAKTRVSKGHAAFKGSHRCRRNLDVGLLTRGNQL